MNHGYSRRGWDWAELKDGETIAVFGSGPVGIMALKLSWLCVGGRVIAIDTWKYCLEIAYKAANVETTKQQGESGRS